ncbi:MAG: response regulator [Sphingobacteriales bacterium]
MSLHTKTKVVIIEDDPVIRNGYHCLINGAEDCFVTNSYGSVEEAIKGIKNDFPDVILLDIDFTGINGIEAIPLLRKNHPGVHVLILTVYDSEDLVFEALRNGASGYLTKNISSETIVSSIRELMQGGAPMSAGIARMVIKSFQKSLDSPLSKREGHVLELISAGKSRTHIADELFIEPCTVKTHIKNIYLKLEVHSKEEALKIAREHRLIK